MKTSELTDIALDWAVLEAAGFFKGYTQFRSGRNFLKVYGVARSAHLHPSTEWAHGGPIIEREGISTRYDPDCNKAQAWEASDDIDFFEAVYGPTPLIAAMRCYVASKLGDDVEIPEELI